jgi:hypothetical protein
MNVGVIVEGHGEEQAVPILVRRIAAWLAPGLTLEVVHPFRVPKGKLLKEAELARAVELVARKVGPGAPILVLIDADDLAACVVGPRLLAQAGSARTDRRVAAVLAVREFEAWFLAAAASLAGARGLPATLVDVPDAEQRGSPKRWLDAQMPEGYSETLDQPAFASLLDLDAARRADSFDKLVRDVARLLGVPPPPRPART